MKATQQEINQIDEAIKLVEKEIKKSQKLMNNRNSNNETFYYNYGKLQGYLNYKAGLESIKRRLQEDLE